GSPNNGVGDYRRTHLTKGYGLAQAAFAALLCSSHTQSSQGSSAATSAVSTVGPVQIRKPGGEARWLATSNAAASCSSRRAMARTVWKRSSGDRPVNHGSVIFSCGEVQEMVAAFSAR